MRRTKFERPARQRQTQTRTRKRAEEQKHRQGQQKRGKENEAKNAKRKKNKTTKQQKRQRAHTSDNATRGACVLADIDGGQSVVVLEYELKLSSLPTTAKHTKAQRSREHTRQCQISLKENRTTKQQNTAHTHRHSAAAEGLTGVIIKPKQSARAHTAAARAIHTLTSSERNLLGCVCCLVIKPAKQTPSFNAKYDTSAHTNHQRH